MDNASNNDSMMVVLANMLRKENPDFGAKESRLRYVVTWSYNTSD